MSRGATSNPSARGGRVRLCRARQFLPRRIARRSSHSAAWPDSTPPAPKSCPQPSSSAAATRPAAAHALMDRRFYRPFDNPPRFPSGPKRHPPPTPLRAPRLRLSTTYHLQLPCRFTPPSVPRADHASAPPCPTNNTMSVPFTLPLPPPTSYLAAWPRNTAGSVTLAPCSLSSRSATQSPATRSSASMSAAASPAGGVPVPCKQHGPYMP